MKIAIWLITAILLATATVVVGVAAWAADWLAGSGEHVARGAASAADAIAALELPRWLAWLSPELVRPLQDWLAWSATALATAGPWLAPLLGWVAPALWIAWSLFAILVLALAGVLHHLANREAALRRQQQA
jgi:hypothetical protein